MECTNVCTKCRFATSNDDAMEQHLLIHKARALKFEPLKTHICQALADSRTQEDTKNWEKALTLVNAMIDPCPECGLLWCRCKKTITEFDELDLMANWIMSPPVCCPADNPCDDHMAKMPPELRAVVEATEGGEAKSKVINDYIAAAHARGEWR